jgi:SAM-dependent methyltransferase
MTLSLPWYARIGAKLVLVRLPFGYRIWQRLNLFKHGLMEKPEYAYRVFKSHYDRAPFARKGQGFVGLEIGPGDSLFSAICAYAFGSKFTYLIDSGRFAREDIEPYQAMATFLARQGFAPPDLTQASSLADVLSASRAEYGSRGIESLRTIPADSVDFVWSHAVLEHIRLNEFENFMRELVRILRPGGVCSHRVDLTDHLGGALNNLRFAQSTWESEWMANSGFYTNRIRFDGMMNMFSRAGFKTEIIGVDRWQKLPTPRSRLSKEFQNMPENNLCVYAFDVLLRKQG